MNPWEMDWSSGAPSGAPKVPPDLVGAVKEFEGFAPKAEWDYRQHSIGYGTQGQPGERIDEAEAERRLQAELGRAAQTVDSFAPNLPAGVRNALTSLTFNVGDDWTRSGLGERIKAGDFAGAQERFLQYTKAGGQDLRGLVRRRQQEVAWFDAPGQATAYTDRQTARDPVASAMAENRQTPRAPAPWEMDWGGRAPAAATPAAAAPAAAAPAAAAPAPDLISGSFDALPEQFGTGRAALRRGLEQNQVDGSGAFDMVPGLGELSRGVMRGASLGWGDEAAGAGAAVGRFLKTGSLEQGGQAYNERVALERLKEARDWEEAPLATGIGTGIGMVGSVGAVTPPGLGSTLSQLAGQGLRGGAAVGAVQGAGDASGAAERAQGALQGGLVGAGVGATAPYVVRGLGVAADLAGAIPRALNNVRRGLVNPDAQAARIVGRQFERDAVTVPELEQRLAAARAAGQPAVVADVAGESTRDLTRVLRNAPGEQRNRVATFVRERQTDQGRRVGGQIEDTVAPGNALDTLDAIRATAAADNAANYSRLYEAHPQVWNADLARFAENADVQAAIRTALRTSNAAAVARGQRPMPNPFIADEAGNITMAPGTQPSLQFWDHVKRALDDRVNTLYRSGNTSEATFARDLRNAFRESLDSAAPAYRATRDIAAERFGFADAVEMGQGIGAQIAGGGRLNADVIQRQIAELARNPRELALARQGVSYELRQAIANRPDGADVVRTVFGTPEKRRALQRVIGNQRQFNEFEAAMLRENLMTATRRAVEGNSTTARQAIDMMDASVPGEVISAAASGNVWGMLTGALKSSLQRAQGINEAVASRMADMLLSDDPAVYQRGLAMVANNQTALQAWRRASMALQQALTQGAYRLAPGARSEE